MVVLLELRGSRREGGGRVVLWSRRVFLFLLEYSPLFFLRCTRQEDLGIAEERAIALLASQTMSVRVPTGRMIFRVSGNQDRTKMVFFSDITKMMFFSSTMPFGRISGEANFDRVR